MLKKIAFGIVCLALLGVGYAYLAYGSMARAGTGFAAKNICSGYFLSGFSPEVMADQTLRGTPVLGTTDSTTLDLEGRRVSKNLYGLFERHAIYTPGIGCTLLAPGEDDSVVEVQALPALALSDELAWPHGTATGEINPGLTAILDEAFAETDPSQPRNSKAVVVIHKGELIAEKYAEGVEIDSGGTFIGSSYMYASARDWARLGQFALQDGEWEGEQLLPEGWVEYLITPTKTAEANRYGAQFWLNRDPTDPEAERIYPSLPADTVFMSGFQGQSVLMIPSQELVITRFGFTAGDNEGIEELAAAVIAELN